jgi:hypothetical protein
MGSVEAGIPYSYHFPGRRWNAFVNAGENDNHNFTSLRFQAGETVDLSLNRDLKTGKVTFSVKGMTWTPKLVVSGAAQARLVTGSLANPPNSHSVATWSPLNVPGGLQPIPWVVPAETVGPLLASTLRNTRRPCN